MPRALVVLWLAGCAVLDGRRGHVPNALTLPALLLGLLAAVVSGWERVIVLGLTGGVLLGAYTAGGLGGADVKALAALAGLWPESLPQALCALALWALLRPAFGRRGDFRALPPIALGVGAAWLMDAFLHPAPREWLAAGHSQESP